MRIQFEEKMAQNQYNFKEEQRALETARRLAIQNDELLDLLLDVNSSTQIPSSLRFDIDTPSDSLTSLPDLIPSNQIQSSSPEGQTIIKSLAKALEARKQLKDDSVPPSKSLSSLLAQFPPMGVSSLPHDQQADLLLPLPITYLTPDTIDTSLATTDLSLGLPIPATHISMGAQAPLLSRQTGRELEEGNPNSVYGWLRANEPQVFLQDGEEITGPTGKVGSLRGAGKRGSTAHITPMNNTGSDRPTILRAEVMQGIDDEDQDSESYVGETSAPANGSRSRKSSGGAGVKRKRPAGGEDDSGGYRPKGGSRPPKKKKNYIPGLKLSGIVGKTNRTLEEWGTANGIP